MKPRREKRGGVAAGTGKAEVVEFIALSCAQLMVFTHSEGSIAASVAWAVVDNSAPRIDCSDDPAADGSRAAWS